MPGLRVNWKIFIIVFLIVSGTTFAGYYFAVPKEIVEVTINPDSSLDIEYWTTFTNYPEGDPIEVIDVGFNSGDFNPDEMIAEVEGRAVESISTSTYIRNGVEIYPEYAIYSNETETLHLKGRNYRRVFEDSDDENYASVVFGTNYFGEKFCSGTKHLTVRMIFPPGASPDNIKYHEATGGAPTNAFVREDGRVVYEYIVPDAVPYEMNMFGVSFPRELVSEVRKPPNFIERLFDDVFGTIWGFILRHYWTFLDYAIMFVGLWGPLLIIGVLMLSFKIRGRKRKMQYLPPLAKMEGTGIKRGLSAPEVALLMEKPLDKVLALVLFGIIKKGAVRVIDKKPLRLEKLIDDDMKGLRKYEKKFLNAIHKDGELREKTLVRMLDQIIDPLDDKMQGFSYKETVEYYRSIMTTAWKMVEEAGTPELVMKEFSNSMQWMMLDDGFDNKSSRMFSGSTNYPMPYWYYYTDPRYYNQYPNVAAAGDSNVMLELPGAKFAKGIVSSFEDAASGVVSRVKSFTRSVTSTTNPAPVRSSSGGSTYGGGGSSGGSSCACACACAGCACACAGGGR